MVRIFDSEVDQPGPTFPGSFDSLLVLPFFDLFIVS
jgi:hypothetical protein